MSDETSAQANGEGSSENRKIFIGGVPHNTHDSEFESVLSKYGQIEDIILMRHPESGEGRGFGFVTYARKKDFEEVLKTEIKIDNRKLDLKVAIPRGQNSSRPNYRRESGGMRNSYNRNGGGPPREKYDSYMPPHYSYSPYPPQGDNYGYYGPPDRYSDYENPRSYPPRSYGPPEHQRYGRYQSPQTGRYNRSEGQSSRRHYNPF